MQLAEFRVKLNILDQEKETAIESADYAKAAALKEEINTVKKQLEDFKASSCESVPQRERKVQDDPNTLTRCLDVLIGLLELVALTTFYPSLRACHETFVLPLMSNKNAEILWRTINIVSLLSLLDKLTLEENYKKMFCAVSFAKKALEKLVNFDDL